MGWSVYIRNGKAYLPTIAEARSGFFLEIEPIEVADIHDTDGLRRAVRAVVDRERRIVPDPSQDDYKNAPILALAGVKTWSAFYKGTQQLGFMRGDSGFEIFRLMPYGGGHKGYRVDESTRIKLPGDLSLAAVVDRVVEEIQKPV